MDQTNNPISVQTTTPTSFWEILSKYKWYFLIGLLILAFLIWWFCIRGKKNSIDINVTKVPSSTPGLTDKPNFTKVKN